MKRGTAANVRRVKAVRAKEARLVAGGVVKRETRDTIVDATPRTACGVPYFLNLHQIVSRLVCTYAHTHMRTHTRACIPHHIDTTVRKVLKWNSVIYNLCGFMLHEPASP